MNTLIVSQDPVLNQYIREHNATNDYAVQIEIRRQIRKFFGRKTLQILIEKSWTITQK